MLLLFVSFQSMHMDATLYTESDAHVSIFLFSTLLSFPVFKGLEIYFYKFTGTCIVLNLMFAVFI